MSSIIDALKKSDANRPRKNHGHKIRMDLKNHDNKKNSRLGFYIILVILIMLVAAVYLQKPTSFWQYFGNTQQNNQQTKQSTTTIVDSGNQKPGDEQPKKLNKPAPKQVQTAAKNQQTKATQIAAKSPATSHINNEQKTALSNEPNAPSTAANKPPQTETIELKIDSAAANNEKVQEQIDQQLDATPMKNKQAINQPEVKKDNSKAADSMPQLFELPFAIRKDLPKLTLSVHIYDPVVENRMAIINGIPVHVGDTFEELLSIQDITQSGVVFRIQNRDFIVLK